MRAKNCDVVILNSPQAIASESNDVQLIGRSGETIQHWTGSKTDIATSLIEWIGGNLPMGDVRSQN